MRPFLDDLIESLFMDESEESTESGELRDLITHLRTCETQKLKEASTIKTQLRSLKGLPSINSA
jgi:hypothetical protein